MRSDGATLNGRGLYRTKSGKEGGDINGAVNPRSVMIAAMGGVLNTYTPWTSWDTYAPYMCIMQEFLCAFKGGKDWASR